MQKEKMVRSNDPAITPPQKLLVSSLVRLEQEAKPVELRRGMSVRSQDSVEAGTVAAVVLDYLRQEVTHILLGFVPPTAVYHLAPLYLIDKIEGETVWLRITSEDIDNLPIYQPDG